MHRIEILNLYIKNLSKWKFILIMGLIGFFLNIVISNISYYILDIDAAANYSQDGLLLTILSSLIMAPFIETLFFQALVLSSLKTHKMRPIFKILISAFCFGILHLIYNVIYAISAFIIGIILAYSYVMYEEKAQNPVIVGTLIHSLMNFLTLFFSRI